MELPKEFTPVFARPVELRSGASVELNHCNPTFRKWEGKPLAFTFGGKTPLEFEGYPLFAELLILRLLQRAGWQGVWVSSFGGKFLREMPTSWRLENAIIPPPKECLKIPRVDGGKLRGCFDVVAWRDGQTLFCESKRMRHDKLRDSQKRWIEAALASGVPQKNLLVVEWRKNEA